MKNRNIILMSTLGVVCVAGIVLAAAAPRAEQTDRVARGKYLVAFGGCNDCHTPLKFTDQGPVPDMSRMLSGHPENVKLPAPELKPGPWSVACAGMTAWAGPWGVTYAANLTPDGNTGLGIWTEEMFVSAMKKGKHMGSGRPILPPMPWQDVAQLTDDDIKAIYAYLRTVPSISNHVPGPTPPPGAPTFE